MVVRDAIFVLSEVCGPHPGDTTPSGVYTDPLIAGKGTKEEAIREWASADPAFWELVHCLGSNSSSVVVRRLFAAVHMFVAVVAVPLPAWCDRKATPGEIDISVQPAGVRCRPSGGHRCSGTPGDEKYGQGQ